MAMAQTPCDTTHRSDDDTDQSVGEAVEPGRCGADPDGESSETDTGQSFPCLDEVRAIAPRATRAVVCTTLAVELAVSAMRHVAVHGARRWSVAPEDIDTLARVVGELVSNAVLHSGSREVSLLIADQGDELVVRVGDSGRWRARPEPGPDAEDEGGGGGLEVVRSASDWWYCSRSAIGTRVVVGLPLTLARV